MKHNLDILALDLGAESGRAILGQFDGKKLQLSEVHRFPNISVRLPDGLHWDTPYQFNEIKNGIRSAVQKTEGGLISAGIDTWGVDFGLLDKHGALVELPFHYRDNRTDGMLEEAFRRVERARIFELTGIQFMQLNSLYQLLAMVVQDSPALKIAETFLTTPDLLNHWLTGSMVSEFTIATTTQCYNPRKHDWARDLLEALNIPSRMFPPIVPPGTILGELLPYVAEETGTGKLKIIAPACHDTGSAVAAVPARDSDFLYISSGTWSLAGIEIPEPIISPEIEALNYTNEGGVGGTIRFLKNITGLWIVQECRRTWAGQGESLSYDDLTKMAEEAKAFQALIDPESTDFVKPGDMPARIAGFCRKTGQTIPESKGEMIRCALESLALRYRVVLEQLERVFGRKIQTIHIVGGGTKNKLLNQFAANATGRTVVTGPVEATAAGNILAQLMGLGEVSSLSEARVVVRASFEPETYQPANVAEWDAAYNRFLKIMK